MSFRSRPRASSRTVLRRLVQICTPALAQGVAQSDADAYVKRYHSVGFALAWISYFLLGLSSLRGLQVTLAANSALRAAVGWDAISVAQLNRLGHARPAQLWEPLVAHLIRRVQRNGLPSRVRLLDTSFFAMSRTLLARRCPHKSMDAATAGIKFGVVLDPENWLPLRVCQHVGQDNDTSWTDELVPPEEPIAGLVYIFDRGFRKYSFYERLMKARAHFLTRGTEQSRYTVQQQRKLDLKHPEVLADAVVILGSESSRRRMRLPVRRIVVAPLKVEKRQRDRAEPIILFTSDLETPAAALAEIYRRRWQIEGFFRWLKRAVGAVRPMGYSPEAQANCMWAALVAYLLALLIQQSEATWEQRQSGAGLKRALHRLCAMLYTTPDATLAKVLDSL